MRRRHQTTKTKPFLFFNILCCCCRCRMARNESLLLLFSQMDGWPPANSIFDPTDCRLEFDGKDEERANQMCVSDQHSEWERSTTFFTILFSHRFRTPDSSDPSIENCWTEKKTDDRETMKITERNRKSCAFSRPTQPTQRTERGTCIYHVTTFCLRMWSDRGTNEEWE